ncbi:MAG TPA: methyltransferase domain-containing protein [Puia sp.]|uniref:methyltransferase domain-containing protein n=1 Tax=Puia sp. TaxID=2045100 RepID=UPI002C7218E7|nr:methyltransferase domain-containing protein [Puia sp.]HVU94886.1 methyltransferase domain-containing protein [Puia sp.]
MNPRVKSLLQKLNIYHPLQSRYRSIRTRLTNQYYKLTYRRYKGTGFTCNFCGAIYQKFVPDHPGPDIAPALNNNHVIAGFGDNVYCPQCGSKNRERLIKAVIERYVAVKRVEAKPGTQKILHFSPEKNLFRWLSNTAAKAPPAAGANITTVDTAPRFYTSIDPHIRYADATRLPFDDNSFDLLIANHILEHIPDDQQAMREMHRVLTPNGVAILQVPYSQTLRNTLEEPAINDPKRQAALFGQRDHVRIYAFDDYLRRLKAAGFTVRVLTPEDLAKFRIFATQPTESVFLCYKY